VNSDDWLRFCDDYNVRLALLSRSRAKVLAKYTDKLASGYTLFYCGDGYDEHEYRCTERIEVPAALEGRSAVANFALRHLDEQVVILIPDDLKCIYWLGEDHPQRLDSSGFLVMLVNLVINALDVGATLFGVSEVDIRKTSPLFPFHTRAMIQGVAGVVGRGVWFDERQKLKEDYDFCLEHLKQSRLVWKDMRYFCFKDMNVLAGGNMPFRTEQREEQEVANLRRWWGDDMIRWSPSGKKGQSTKHLRIIV
jgi:hypothetical protein